MASAQPALLLSPLQSGKVTDLTEKTGRRRRTQDPLQILKDPDLAERLRSLDLAPWEVLRSRDVIAALRVDVRTFNDWRYTGQPQAPPCERLGLYPGNVRYYRKDRLVAWAESAGHAVPHQDLWPVAADYLADRLHLARPVGRDETNDLLVWLQRHGILSLKTRPRIAPFRPYHRPDVS